MVKNNLILLILLSLSFIFFLSFKVNGNVKNNVGQKEAYELYKSKFLTSDGRVIDPDKHNITTSEGQSYILLQSLMFDDEKTFGRAYKWTKDNLQRPDKLFSWLWGKGEKGEYKVLDYNSASDADVDIAFALVVANKKWHKQQYLKEAKGIITSIWDNEVRRVGDHLVLMPGSLQNKNAKIEINPSYFAPYAFKLFQKHDDLHDWSAVVDSSYYYLNQCMSKTSKKLPPNWFLIENGEIVLEDSERSDFSYDAVRVFPRVYFDFMLTGDKRALPILEKSNLFIDEWKESRTLHTNYKKNGELRDNSQYIGAISVILPVIDVYDKDAATQIYQDKLSSKYITPNYWQAKNDYYGKNLSLFGWFLYDKKTKECREMRRLKILKK